MVTIKADKSMTPSELRNTQKRNTDKDRRLLALSRLLQQKRSSMGMTVVALSAASGVSKSSIEFIEKAHHYPRLDTLNKICFSLGETMSSVLESAGY